MSTAWDVESATYNSANFTTAGSTAPQGIYFRADGKKMYLADPGDDELNEYNLGTAWDITSASWHALKSLPGMTPVGIHFRPDGRRVYFSDGSSDNVRQYTLSIAWDITTAVWDSNFGTDIDAVEDVTFSPDGSKMYIVDGSAEDDIHEFTLTTPWMINTAELTKLFHIYEDATPNGITFRPDGTRMYVVGNANNSLYEYHLGLVIPGNVAIGHEGSYDNLQLDVRSKDNNQILVHDSRNQAVNRGGGIMFGATYTDGGAETIGARIGLRKPNSISGEEKFDFVFETEDGSGLVEAFRIARDQKVGFGATDPDYQVEIEGPGSNQLQVDSSDAYALGVGGGILFSGRSTGGNNSAPGGSIQAAKWSAGNGELGFDLVLTSHKNSVGDLVEMLRLSAEDGIATIAGAVVAAQTGSVSDNYTFGESFPAYLDTSATNVQGNVFIGANHGVNFGDTAGLVRGYSNILIGDHNGQKLDGTGTGVAGEHDGNILIGSNCGSNGRLDDDNILIGDGCECVINSYSDCINIGNAIFGELGASGVRVRIGAGIGTSLLTSAALEISSTIGALVVPRMTTSQRTALTAVNGMIIYDTSQNAFRKYQNGSWQSF
jgi:sugar lactone lactonase YvrE